MTHPRGHLSYPQPLRWWQWWPVLAVPVMTVVVYFAHGTSLGAVFTRSWQDNTPLPYMIISAAGVLFAGRWISERNPLMLMMAAMSAAILGREIHYEGSSIVAYATLFTLLSLGHRYYHAIAEPLARGRIRQWIIMTAVSYVMAVAIAKGWFKAVVPLAGSRSDLEETVENIAHLMLLLTSFTGYRRAAGPNIEHGRHNDIR